MNAFNYDDLAARVPANELDLPWMRTMTDEMSNSPAPVSPTESLELPVAELLRRARPLPPLEEMLIDDLTSEEAEAFLVAIRS